MISRKDHLPDKIAKKFHSNMDSFSWSLVSDYIRITLPTLNFIQKIWKKGRVQFIVSPPSSLCVYEVNSFHNLEGNIPPTRLVSKLNLSWVHGRLVFEII